MLDLIATRRETDRLLERHRQAIATVRREESEAERVRSLLTAAVESREIVQGIAQGIQQQVHRRIAEIVTRCLNAVFDEPYEFLIRFDRKRGKTEARLVFVRDGVELDDPMNEVGGGVIDVASLGLRLACLVMTRPRLRRLLVLDEPWKNLRGVDYRRRVKTMLLRLAEELDVQFVINTDIPEFQLGYVVDLDGG